MCMCMTWFDSDPRSRSIVHDPARAPCIAAAGAALDLMSFCHKKRYAMTSEHAVRAGDTSSGVCKPDISSTKITTHLGHAMASSLSEVAPFPRWEGTRSSVLELTSSWTSHFPFYLLRYSWSRSCYLPCFHLDTSSYFQTSLFPHWFSWNRPVHKAIMFGGGYKGSKLRVNLRLAINRLKLLQKKKSMSWSSCCERLRVR